MKYYYDNANILRPSAKAKNKLEDKNIEQEEEKWKKIQEGNIIIKLTRDFLLGKRQRKKINKK